jgi:PAS domain S-box-containing protein
MTDIPEIIKELRQEERNGTLSANSLINSSLSSVLSKISESSNPKSTEDTYASTSSLMDFGESINYPNSLDIYRSLFDSSSDGIVVVDLKGHILSCNPAAAKMIGYKSKELIGKHFTNTSIFNLKELPNYIKLFSDVINGRTQGPFELKYYRKDRSFFWAEVHVTTLKNNKEVSGIVAISRDITYRKETEKKIKQSEKRYRELYEGSRDGFALVDKNGFIIESNSTFQKIIGYSDKELRHLTYEDITVGKWYQKENEIIKDQVKTRGYSDVYEKEYRHKNGTIIPIEIRTYDLQENGKSKGMWVFVRDISDRKHKELELEESRSHFENLFNAIADPIVIVDKYGKFLEISDGVVNQTGYTRNDLIGKNFLGTKLVTARSKTILLANLAKRMTGLNISPYEIDVVTKVGEIIPFEINAARINFKGQSADLVIFRDVRERRRAEDALRESEEKFRLLSDQSLMGIAIIQGTQIKYVNQAAANITGYSIDEMKNRGVELVQSLIYQDDKEFVLDQLQKKLQGNPDIVPHYTYRIIAKSGKTRWVEQFSKTIDFGGKKADFVTIINITGKKEAEEKIRHQNIQLKKLDKLKTNFLNITSHELRTPMTAMKGYNQMLISEVLGKLSDEQKSALEVIHRNTNRLDHLIQDILDTSRLESGTMKFIPTETDLSCMIKDIIETMQQSADIKQIKIDSSIQQNLPNVIIDQERIKQVFDNILCNAIKFSPEESLIHLQVKQEKEFIQFEIQDFGKGIPEDEHENIFETFYQVESGKDRTFGGTGLGLTISRGIILGHGGKIWVESQIDKGSTFKFTLPINPVQDIEGTFKKIDIFKVRDEYKAKSSQEG